MHKKLLSILALTVLITSTSVGCSGASSTDSTLTILSITEGDVFVMKVGADDWTEATVGMSLAVGDIIKTDDDSGAEITFFDGSTIELEAGTQIQITSLDTSPDTGTKTITLMQTVGTTISRVTKLLDPASSYAIETPSGVAAVRGSTMIVRIVFDDPNYEDGTVLITNLEGHIYWIGHGEELQLAEGAQVIATNETAQLVQLSLAVDDGVTTDEDTPVAIAAPGVLGNDSGLTVGDKLTVTAVDTSGTVGNVTAWAADGSFTYNPGGQFKYLEAGNSTTDSFSYTVTDDYGITDTATVTITINGVYDPPPYSPPTYSPPVYYPPINHPPVAVDDVATTDEDSWVNVATPGVLDNDSDPDASDTLAVTSVDTSETIGTVTAWGPDGSFTYDPNGQFESLSAGNSTTDSLTYTISDGHGGTDTATVTITINGVDDTPGNDLPVAGDDTYITDEDSPMTVAAPGVLDNDSDPDAGDILTVTAVNTSGSAGTVTPWSADGSFTYDPNGQFEYLQVGNSTTDVFTYIVSDGHGGTDTADVTITVHGVNDPPEAENDSATTPQDTPVTVGILGNDSDPDGDTPTVYSATNGTHGSVINNGSSVTYNPNPGFTGTDTFTYIVSDGHGGTDTATVTVTVAVDIPEPVSVTRTAYVAYEDREAGDFDYNDFGMNMVIEEISIGDCLTEINMQFDSVTKLSGDVHDIHIRRTLNGGTTYNYTIQRTPAARGTETSVSPASDEGDFDIVLFDTRYFTPGGQVTIHIEIIDGGEPYNPAPWAYYDPYMNNRNDGEHHIGNTQPAVSPLPTYNATYYVPFILVIPVTGWSPPAEGECVTVPYPCFDNYYALGSPEDWYETESCD